MEGKKVQIGSPLEAIKNGIGYLPEDRKLQGLFLEMSIEENVVSGNLKRIIKRRFIDKRRISLSRKNIRKNCILQRHL